MNNFFNTLTRTLILSTLFSFSFADFYNVEISETGESTLFIFQDEIANNLDVGDELGLFDNAGIVDDQGNIGEILIGAGVWTGSQVEITAIMAVNLSEFGGPILPGAISGNTMSLKVWKTNESLEYDASYSTSSGSGSFNGLFTAINGVELIEQDPPHFNVEISETGESTLFIFENGIDDLEDGDELGLFDANGVVDSQGNIGEVLVGAGVWSGEQLEIVAIGAVDLSEFGGPILPGAVSGNNMMLKVWKESEEMEYDVSYNLSSGGGTFNGLFSSIDEIFFAPSYTVVINEYFTRANEDVPDYVELFNYGSEDIDLTGWDLVIDGDGELGSFDGYVLGAGEYLLLADGGDPFFDSDEEEYYAGEDIANSLNFDIGLGSGGDPIQLLDASGNEVDYIDCNDDLGWPTVRGQAGELSDPYSDNNDPSNWASSNADGTYMATEDGEYGEDFGTPGEENSNYVVTIPGCTDSSACNYNPDATVDDGSCDYFDEQLGECDCDGNLLDCAGECGGDAFIDDCGQCVEGGTNPDDCLGADDGLPAEFSLSQNYPNPFNPVTTINFDIAEPSYVELKIYDIVGNYVMTLVSGYYNPDRYSIRWDGVNQFGNDVSSGVYIYQLNFGEGLITKKMILIR